MKMIKFNGKNKQLDQKNCFSVEVLTDMSPKKKKKSADGIGKHGRSYTYVNKESKSILIVYQ